MYGPETHAVPVVTGWSNLLLRSVVNAGELTAGDFVTVLTLPDGKFYLNKGDGPGSVEIAEITLSHVLFSGLGVEDAHIGQN